MGSVIVAERYELRAAATNLDELGGSGERYTNPVSTWRAAGQVPHQLDASFCIHAARFCAADVATDANTTARTAGSSFFADIFIHLGGEFVYFRQLDPAH
jgi:hypothetical protein